VWWGEFLSFIFRKKYLKKENLLSCRVGLGTLLN
jgi:hypothetical protein